MGNIFSSPSSCSVSKIARVFASPPEEDDDLDDPVERMLKKTGCLEQHYAVQECIAETKDWRQCQNQVKEFRQCMEKHKKQGTLRST